ncbi:unnamed protein product [Leuciscus chuanchicus]
MQYNPRVSPYVHSHINLLKNVAPAAFPSLSSGTLSQCYPISHCMGYHGTTVTDTLGVSPLLSSFRARRCGGLHGALDGVQQLWRFGRDSYSSFTTTSLILSYTLAFPILNDTSTESSKADFSNSTDGQGNRSRGGPMGRESVMQMTPTFEGNRSRDNVSIVFLRRESVIQMTPTFEGNRSRGGPMGSRDNVSIVFLRLSYSGIGSNCLLPTCNLHTLPHRLQTGDEKAGKITQDPYGPGKK